MNLPTRTVVGIDQTDDLTTIMAVDYRLGRSLAVTVRSAPYTRRGQLVSRWFAEANDSRYGVARTPHTCREDAAHTATRRIVDFLDP